MLENKVTDTEPGKNMPVAENGYQVKWLNTYVNALVNSEYCYSFLLDSDMKILYFSDSLLNMTEIEDGEAILGRPIQEVFRLIYDENFYSRAMHRLQRALYGEEHFFEDDTIVWPTGEKRLYQINYKKLMGAADSFGGVLFYAQDITSLRMEEAQRRVDAMLHSSVLPCFVWDEKGDALAFNREAARIFGVPEDISPKEFGALAESLLQPRFQPCGRESEAIRKELVDEALQNAFASFEGFFQTKSGTPLFVRITILRALWPFGFRLIVYIQDKTEIYLRGRELERIREQNELQLAKLNLVVQSSGAGLWDMPVVRDDPLNPANTFTWSDEFRHLLGFDDENDFPNLLGSWSERLHPDDKERTLEQVEKHLSDTSGSTLYDVEYRLMRKDGGYGYFRAAGSTFRDEDGNPIRIVGTMRDITQEKTILYETEKQREELERTRLQNEDQLTKLNLVVQASGVGLWNVTFARGDVENPIVATWSDEFRQMLGFTDREEFPDILDSWAAQLHPDDRELAIEQIKKHMLDTTGQTPYDAEFRLRKKNGQYGYYRSFGETIRDADGRALSMSGALMDITEAKEILHRTEQNNVELKRIREQNELQLINLNLVIQASGIGLWGMDVVAEDPLNPVNIFTWSDEFRHLLGFSDENDFPDVFGSWSDLLHPDDRERTLAELEKHLLDKSGATPLHVEHRLLKNNGEIGYFRASGETLRDEEGNAIRFVGALMDMTEATNLLKDLEKQRRDAKVSEERARIMLDSAPMMCILLNAQGNVVDCNQETLKVLNISSKSEFLLNFHSYTPEYHADGILTADKTREILQVLDEEEGASYHFERTFQTATGEIVPVESTIVRIPWKEAHYYLSFSRDLREIKAQEKELEEIRAEKNRAEIQREAALAADEAKSIFLATMSHEIRTPMNAVMGMVEILLSENLNERQHQYVSDIRTSAMALLDIVNDILDLSKIQVGKLKTESRHYDFSMLIDNLSAMAYFLVSRKSIVFNLVVSEGAPVYLYGDEVRLRQAILNLLSNAVKFTDEGTVSLIVTHTESTVKITVSDTGIGILPDEIPRLFEPFEQFDTSRVRRDEGTGLGLTITKAIVELMEGQLTVESVYGHGSSFHIEIPMVPGDEALVLREDSRVSMIYAPDAKLLVVDDNLANLKVASGLLQLFQIRSETVSSGRDAIRMVQDNDYDLVLMDYRMPEMDGAETTREIRNLGLTVPIIACTASVIAEAKVKMMEAGMNDFLAKPITKADLKNILKKWVPAGKKIEATGDGAVLGNVEDDRYRKFWGIVENIQGLSVPLGLSRVGGQRDVYEDTLKLIMKEIEKSKRNLNEFLDAGNLKNFAIEVHSMLGLLANVGAMELSEKARELELASDRQDIDFCSAHLPLLKEGLSGIRKQLQAAFAEISHNDGPITIPEALPPVFEAILRALDKVDLMQIRKEMNIIDEMNLQGALKEKMEDIKDAVMMMDYAAAEELMRQLLEKDQSVNPLLDQE